MVIDVARTEDNPAIIPHLQEGDPHAYYCLTSHPWRLWSIEPCPPSGWSVTMSDFTTKQKGTTRGGFHPSAVAMTLQMWGLTDPVVWTAEMPHQDSTEMVYAIGQVGGGLVKIGRSNNVPHRLASIQRMSPVRLVVLWQRPGGAELETRLHHAFAEQRTHGEWFDFGDVDLITALEREMNR